MGRQNLASVTRPHRMCISLLCSGVVLLVVVVLIVGFDPRRRVLRELPVGVLALTLVLGGSIATTVGVFVSVKMLRAFGKKVSYGQCWECKSGAIEVIHEVFYVADEERSLGSWWWVASVRLSAQPVDVGLCFSCFDAELKPGRRRALIFVVVWGLAILWSSLQGAYLPEVVVFGLIVGLLWVLFRLQFSTHRYLGETRNPPRFLTRILQRYTAKKFSGKSVYTTSQAQDIRKKG